MEQVFESSLGFLSEKFLISLIFILIESVAFKMYSSQKKKLITILIDYCTVQKVKGKINTCYEITMKVTRHCWHGPCWQRTCVRPNMGRCRAIYGPPTWFVSITHLMNYSVCRIVITIRRQSELKRYNISVKRRQITFSRNNRRPYENNHFHVVRRITVTADKITRRHVFVVRIRTVTRILGSWRARSVLQTDVLHRRVLHHCA